MNGIPQIPETGDEMVFANIVALSEALNTATRCLARRENDAGFAQMIHVMEVLAVFLQAFSESKHAVYSDAEELGVVPCPMQCIAEDPGQVFPCPFLVGPLPRKANIGGILSALSACAAYNLGIACQVESFVPSDYHRCEQFRLQSRRFYKTAYDLLDRLSYISPDGTLIHVYMALCTNLAEIAFGEADLDASRKWRSALRDTLGCIPEDKSCVVYKHFHNTSLFYLFDIPAAPAA